MLQSLPHVACTPACGAVLDGAQDATDETGEPKATRLEGRKQKVILLQNPWARNR